MAGINTKWSIFKWCIPLYCNPKKRTIIQQMATILSVLVTLLLFSGIFYFGSKKKHYNQVKHTISELGENGSPVANRVNFGLFLPAGLLLLLIAMNAGNNGFLPGYSICIATGYLVAAFFPCDPGSPQTGSSRQHLHNLGGLIEYAGASLYLYKAEEIFDTPFIIGYKLSAGIIIICMVLISIPSIRPRGFIQRIAETVLFINLVALSTHT